MEGNKTTNQDIETKEETAKKEAGEAETDKKAGIYYVKLKSQNLVKMV